MELSPPPTGPIADESVLSRLAIEPLPLTIVEEAVDCLAERLVSASSPLPEHCSAHFKQHEAELEKMQREVWVCHWGVVVMLCVYQQLISHVSLGVREAIAQTLGAFLAGEEKMDNTQLYAFIESEFKRNGISLKPDMDLIHRELACTALHSTIVCYIKDIALNMHAARRMGTESTIEAMFPSNHRTCVGRNFFLRVAKVSSSLLDILYDVLPRVNNNGPWFMCSP